MSKTVYNKKHQLKRTVMQPKLPFGESDTDSAVPRFNLFNPSYCLEILNGNVVLPNYKRPETTLKFLESLLPNEVTRKWLLSFLKAKLTTFDYSQIVLYFVGVGGSGKDTLIKLLGLSLIHI